MNACLGSRPHARMGDPDSSSGSWCGGHGRRQAPDWGAAGARRTWRTCFRPVTGCCARPPRRSTTCETLTWHRLSSRSSGSGTPTASRCALAPAPHPAAAAASGACTAAVPATAGATCTASVDARVLGLQVVLLPMLLTACEVTGTVTLASESAGRDSCPLGSGIGSPQSSLSWLVEHPSASNSPRLSSSACYAPPCLPTWRLQACRGFSPESLRASTARLNSFT